MKFNIKCKVEKQLWSNQVDSWLFKVNDTESTKGKSWTIFTKKPLMENVVYEIFGYVTESKDKKTKDQNGRDIWRATFSADEVKELSEKVPF